MKSSYELEADLKAAKEREKVEQLNQDLEEALKYKNKCYATHLLSRGTERVGTTVAIRKIEDVVIQNDKIIYWVYTIEYRRLKDFGVDFQTRKTYYDNPFHYSSFKHEITLEQFEATRQISEAQIDLIGDSLKKGLNPPSDYINGHTHTEEANNISLMMFSGIPFIELNDQRCENTNLSIKELLIYNHHPFVIGGKYLINNSYSKIIVKQIADDMEKHAYDWGSSILERDYPRVQALRKFLIETIWLD